MAKEEHAAQQIPQDAPAPDSGVVSGPPIELTPQPGSVKGSPHTFTGVATMHRVGRWSFPTHELRHEGTTLARLGRSGWLRIYMGSGQRIETADGEPWRIRAFGSGGSMYPVVLDSVGRRVAMAGSNGGTYGINGRDFACTLYSDKEHRFGRSNAWILREFETEIAAVTRYPAAVDATLPVHLGAVLLAFVLVRYGLPEESSPAVPVFRWGLR
ncbi:MAG: hypothetical protein ACR2N7_00820 [Acidimicrobiia bacterium]